GPDSPITHSPNKRPPPSVSTDTSSLRKANPKGRSALLADIQQGTRLRKVTQINDRSAPQIESKKSGLQCSSLRTGLSLLSAAYPRGLFLYCRANPESVSLPGGKTGQGPGSRAPSPRLPNKTISGPLIPPASPRLGNTSEAHGAARTAPPRPNVPAPPPPTPPPPPPPLPPPLPSSSPNKTPLVSPSGPLTKGNPPVVAPPAPCAPPPPPPPPPPTPPPLPPCLSDKAVKPQLAPLHLPPIPPPSETPPPLPPKSPNFQAPPQKAGAQALPALPAPPGSQPFLQKKRHGRPGAGGGKLNPPPAPPARSPTTELSSKSQQATAWTLMQQPGGQLRNGSLHIIDDFESKFTFHSVEDFPPPDEYKPCQKIYPSKIPRSRTPGPWLQAEAVGQSSDDIRGRNSQLSLKTLR
uniref:WAS/WASL interacting protein family member 3 n=1 Tax=Saimiri boliviensis boliviensis TaxID=39432 RepID=A0A2K6SW88_SAIBB